MAIFSKAKIREIFEDAEIEVSKDVLKKICDLHTDALDNLKDTVKELKTDLENAERERDDYKAKAPKDGEETISKSKYDELKTEFEQYKTDITSKETLQKKKDAIKSLAKSLNLSDKGVELAVKYAKYDDIELDENGKIKDETAYSETLKDDFSGYVEKDVVIGANTGNPPSNTGGGSTKTKEEILAIKDTAKRQAEIAKNPALFGIKLD